MKPIDPTVAKNRSRGFSDDLSPDAVSHRLDILAELWEASRYLSGFQPAGERVLKEDEANYREKNEDA
jgi:hypothetical protein